MGSEQELYPSDIQKTQTLNVFAKHVDRLYHEYVDLLGEDYLGNICFEL